MAHIGLVGNGMELEELNADALIDKTKDVEFIESWADRNGVTYETARHWVNRGIIPSIKIGKRRMVNCVQFRQWLLEQEWVA